MAVEGKSTRALCDGGYASGVENRIRFMPTPSRANVEAHLKKSHTEIDFSVSWEDEAWEADHQKHVAAIRDEILTAPSENSLPRPDNLPACNQVCTVASETGLADSWEDVDWDNSPYVMLGDRVGALICEERVEDAWEVVRLALKDVNRKHLVNGEIVAATLMAFGKTYGAERMFEIRSAICATGCSCNTKAFNVMLDVCVKSGMRECIPAILSDMRSDGTKPDVITYSTTIQSYCLAKDALSALKAVGDMKTEVGVHPDSHIYTMLIDCCAKQRRRHDAEQLFAEMQHHGIKPTCYTVNVLVKLYGRIGDLSRAVRIVESLASTPDVSSNVPVYTSLLQACAQNLDFTRAFKIHDRLVKGGKLLFDEKYYSVLVWCCLQTNNMGLAIKTTRVAYAIDGDKIAGRLGDAHTPGVDPSLVAEIVWSLRRGEDGDTEVADALVSDLEARHGLQISPRRRKHRGWKGCC